MEIWNILGVPENSSLGTIEVEYTRKCWKTFKKDDLRLLNLAYRRARFHVMVCQFKKTFVHDEINDININNRENALDFDSVDDELKSKQILNRFISNESGDDAQFNQRQRKMKKLIDYHWSSDLNDEVSLAMLLHGHESEGLLEDGGARDYYLFYLNTIPFREIDIQNRYYILVPGLEALIQSNLFNETRIQELEQLLYFAKLKSQRRNLKGRFSGGPYRWYFKNVTLKSKNILVILLKLVLFGVKVYAWMFLVTLLTIIF